MRKRVFCVFFFNGTNAREGKTALFSFYASTNEIIQVVHLEDIETRNVV